MKVVGQNVVPVASGDMVSLGLQRVILRDVWRYLIWGKRSLSREENDVSK